MCSARQAKSDLMTGQTERFTNSGSTFLSLYPIMNINTDIPSMLQCQSTLKVNDCINNNGSTHLF